jgi:hypothetical protein
MSHPQSLARPTIYDGILMRSRLEAWWAQVFDEIGISWTYEASNFASRSGQYLPDFRLDLRSGHTYVEIKPPLSSWMLTAAQHRMEIVWASEPDVTLWIVEGSPVDSFAVHEAHPKDWDEINDPVLVGAGNWRPVGSLLR